MFKSRIGIVASKVDFWVMSSFGVYFVTGIRHILDVHAYDHLLFLIALVSVYRIHEWKRLLILATSFTVGHSLTLALAVTNVVTVAGFELFGVPLVELLIPVTIVVTAIFNVARFPRQYSSHHRMVVTGETSPSGGPAVWIATFFFGLIHGLGFAGYLTSLLGKQGGIFSALLAFNLGVEVAQIIAIVMLMAITFIAQDLLSMNRRDWALILNGAAMGVAITIIINLLFS